jgi:hypothetical protein
MLCPDEQSETGAHFLQSLPNVALAKLGRVQNVGHIRVSRYTLTLKPVNESWYTRCKMITGGYPGLCISSYYIKEQEHLPAGRQGLQKTLSDWRSQAGVTTSRFHGTSCSDLSENNLPILSVLGIGIY